MYPNKVTISPIFNFNNRLPRLNFFLINYKHTRMNKQLRKLNDYFGNVYKKEKFPMQVEATDRKVIKVSLELDERIIKLLKKFEQKQRFLSPAISLTNMSSDFNTNSTYLSAIIKKHKNINFSGYINDLRIDYIITKLETTPQYLNYKIAYLAEECGFSSHTVFIRVFKEKTGVTPSVFIEILKSGII